LIAEWTPLIIDRPATSPTDFPAADQERVARLHNLWRDLCDRYLPVAQADSIWRFSRTRNPQDPEQGWKLHVSATVLNATTVLEKVAPLLLEQGVQFKGPASLQELHRINAGLGDGYSQVGKCLTVYPRSSDEATALAERLHAATRGLAAPAAPYDLRYRSGGNVFYRYGAFRHMLLEDDHGRSTPALRDPQGKLIPDLRTLEAAMPDWANNPFPFFPPEQKPEPDGNPLKTTYRVFRALTQRGKGGVYQALDLSAAPPRFCVLKEGRRLGDMGWDGRDGWWRIRHEESVLRQLRAQGIDVPQVYASFEQEGNFYLAIEFIEGANFQAMLDRRRRRLSVAQALRYSCEMAKVLSEIHAAGWIWRDCKPANFILTRKGTLRPLDFEGACTVEQPDPMGWGTPGFAPGEGQTKHAARSSQSDDLYSLGAVIYLLLTGRLPESPLQRSWWKLRRDVPAEAQEIVAALLAAPPDQRPNAVTVARQLAAVTVSAAASGRRIDDRRVCS
jgi:hypothetical protein